MKSGWVNSVPWLAPPFCVQPAWVWIATTRPLDSTAEPLLPPSVSDLYCSEVAVVFTAVTFFYALSVLPLVVTLALSFTAPMAYALDWVILFSDRSKVLTLAVVSVLGVIAGSAVQAVAAGDFRWEGFGGTEDLANHLIGGMLMGIGGVTAMGCTVGQGLSGISTLSASSFLAVAGIMLGAVVALRYQNWRLERAV